MQHQQSSKFAWFSGAYLLTFILRPWALPLPWSTNLVLLILSIQLKVLHVHSQLGWGQDGMTLYYVFIVSDHLDQYSHLVEQYGHLKEHVRRFLSKLMIFDWGLRPISKPKQLLLVQLGYFHHIILKGFHLLAIQELVQLYHLLWNYLYYDLRP